MKNFLPPVVVSIAALTPVAAQSPDDTQLELVTISATRIPTRVMDVPATVTVKDAESLDRELVFNLEDLVRYEPGVSMRNEGGRFGASGPSIRGIGGNRVLMEVDGVRLPDAFAIGSFANAGRDVLDTDLLKRVEIVRYWARILPQLPRLVHQALAQTKAPDLAPLLADLARTQRQQRRLLGVIAVLLTAILLGQLLMN